MDNNERILALLRGEGEEVCPACFYEPRKEIRGQTWDCVKCHGLGRIRTTPEGEVELAVVALLKRTNMLNFEARHYDEMSEEIEVLREQFNREYRAHQEALARAERAEAAGFQVSAELEHWRQEQGPRLTRENAELRDRVVTGQGCAAHDLTVSVLREQNATLLGERDTLKAQLVAAQAGTSYQQTCIHHSDDERQGVGCPVCTKAHVVRLLSHLRLAHDMRCQTDLDAYPSEKCCGLADVLRATPPDLRELVLVRRADARVAITVLESVSKTILCDLFEDDDFAKEAARRLREGLT